MKINIETIPHNEMRYDTCGDYWVDSQGVIQVRISKMNPIFEWFVLLHEMVELFLCKIQRIDFKKIDDFDIKFEKDRKRGLHNETEEPGDHPDAPYNRQHCMATSVERMLCAYLGVHWKKYDETVLNLEYEPKSLKSYIPRVD
jgi:hypothetical protein